MREERDSQEGTGEVEKLGIALVGGAVGLGDLSASLSL